MRDLVNSVENFFSCSFARLSGEQKGRKMLHMFVSLNAVCVFPMGNARRKKKSKIGEPEDVSYIYPSI